MAWHVHEMQIGLANQLDFWSVEEPVVVLADESSVFDGFLREFPHVGFRADDPDVVWLVSCFLV